MSEEQELDGHGVARRRFITRSGALAALATTGGLGALAACGSDDDDGGASSTGGTAPSPTGGSEASGEPIRVGVMLPTQGPYAALGSMQANGIALALGDSIAGRPVEIVTIEEPVEAPQDAIQRVRGAISGDKIQALVGIISGATALAVRDTVHDAELPLIVTNAVTRAVTGTRRSDYIFRTSLTGYQVGIKFGPWLYENVGTSMVTAAPDYASGQELIEYTARFFEEEGGTVTNQWWPPLGSSDYGAILTEMAATDADLAYCFFAGGDAVRFVTQYEEFELKENLQLTGLTLVDDITLEAQGDAAEGTILMGGWHRGLENPENVEFMANFEAAYGEKPNSYASSGYVGGNTLRMAIEEVGGEIENVEALTATLEDVSFTTPSGTKLRFDPDTNHAITEITVQRIDRLPSGELGFVEIANLGEAVDPGDDVEP